MSYTQQVLSDHPVQVQVGPSGTTILVLDGDTVFYGDTNQTSSSLNQGSLTSGQSATITDSPLFIRSASVSDVSVQVGVVGTATQDVVVGSDGRVGGPGGTGLTSSVVSASAAGGIPAWAPSTAYTINQLVSNGGVTYICLQNHTSGGSFSGVGTNWAIFAGSAGVFVNSTYGVTSSGLWPWTDAQGRSQIFPQPTKDYTGTVGMVVQRSADTFPAMSIIQDASGVNHFAQAGVDHLLPEAIVAYDYGLVQARTTLSSGLSTGAPITSLPVNALPTAIPAASIVFVTDGASNSQLFTCSAGAAQGVTSIPVTSAAPNFAYASGATVQGWLSGDIFRVAHGGHFNVGPGVGTPATSVRFDIASNSQEDPSTTTLLRTTLAAGTPASVVNYYTAQNGSTTEHQFKVGGAAAIGAAWGNVLGTSTGLEVWNGGVANIQTNADPQLYMSRRGTSTYSFQIGIDSGGTGAKLNRFYVQDNSSVKQFSISTAGSVLIGAGNALAQGATDGFLYIPNSNGQPQGTPTAYDTRTAVTWDTANYVWWLFTPSHGWRQSQFYRTVHTGNYTASSADRIIACTGTATTAQTITLAAATSMGPGFVLIVKDEAGGAATNNVTVTANAADGIDGGATGGSTIINTNHGVARLYCTGNSGNGAGNGWMTF